ncbi:hypothetical protein ACI51X_18875 [Pectobacterium versatile]
MLNEKAIQDVDLYFQNIHGPEGRLASNETFDIVPGLSKDGAVQYQTYQFNEAPKHLQKQVKAGRILMERFVAVASAAVNKKAPSNKEKYHYDIWKEVSNQLIPAFFTDPIKGEQNLNTTVKGVEVAKSVIQFAGNVIAG